MGAPRTPRPVADAPVAGLEDGSAIAKAWLVALVDRAPLEEAASVPAGSIAAQGPALVAALLDALRSDGAVDALGPAVAPVREAGASGPAAVVAACEALRAAAWSALRSRLVDPDPALIGDLADRLAHVCSLLAGHALAPGAPVSAPAAATVTPAPSQQRTLGAALAPRLAAGAGGLAAVEAADRERLLAADDEKGAFAAALDTARAAARAALLPGEDLLATEPGRWWIVTDGDPRAAAARAVAAAAAAPGAPAFSAGAAAIPADGDSEATLAATADERLLAALAAGVPVA